MRVAAVLGFERTKGFYSSAAPLSEDVFQYFQKLDMPIQELLGSSETTGPQTASTPGTGTKLGSVGRCYPAWDEGKTAELIDGQGFVHSGGLGHYDEDGFLFIGG